MAARTIHDDFVAVARELVNVDFTIGRSQTAQFNETASRDAIRHYVFGVSDLNPLWRDDEYARKGRHGGIVAPPTFPYSVVLPSMAIWQDPLIRFAMDREIRWTMMYGGTTWEFFGAIPVGTEIHPVGRLIGAETKKSKTAGEITILTGEVRYLDNRGTLLARSICPQVRYLSDGAEVERTSRLQGRDAERAADFADARSPETLAVARMRQGAMPRYWEDVAENESLPELPKGRMRTTDIIRWTGATMGPPFISGSGGVPMGEAESAGAAHTDAGLAATQGVPGMYDNGPLRGAWLSQVVTDWAGDWADMVGMSYRLRMLNIVGDHNKVCGTVTKKEPDTVPGMGLATVAVWVENDRGQRTADGTVQVRLPLKESR